tara:strand:- start:241 stop:465 length:225 start_codon:yes stop_codon:yes gene_type:complete
MRTHTGTYSEEINDNILEIEYDFYYAPSTWEQPSETIVTITKALANGRDITDFYFAFFDTDIMHDRIMDYAMEL